MNGCILAFKSPPFVTDRFGSKSKHSRGDRRYPANSGHSSRTLNFLHSRHWNDLRGTEGIASEPHHRLAWKLQLPLNRLEARLLAQRVEQWVRL
jgi:hypothetical protein